MDISDAKELPLLVEHPIGGERPVGELFDHPAGLVFLDTGWNANSAHPVHLLEGTPQGDGPWSFEDGVVVRILVDGEPLKDVWRNWVAFKQGEGKDLVSRPRALQVAQGAFPTTREF